MHRLVGLEGRMSRGAYALCVPLAFCLPHLTVAAINAAYGWPFKLHLVSLLAPVRDLVVLNRVWLLQQGMNPDSFAHPLAALVMAVTFVSAWIQAAMAYRRTVDADATPWLAVLALASPTQIVLYLWLAVAPRREAVRAELRRIPVEDENRPSDWMVAIQATVAAVLLTLVGTAVGTLLFGTYAGGLFILLPFLVGTLVGYIANRHRDIGGPRTMRLALLSATMAGLGLLIVALEGLFCILVVAPIALLPVLLGALFGHAVARRGHRSLTHCAASLAMLPIVFTSDAIFPPSAVLHTEQSVEIAAPPPAVWRALVEFDMRGAERPLTAHVGMAYPIRAEILGEGVGATRLGVFSTGTAEERVTEWLPERRLAFVVDKDPPAMSELSPYDHVHAPHVAGYFRTLETSFELQPLEGGRTRLVERTRHELRLDPIPYWLPMARWAVDRNNVSVLEHLRRQAERAAAL